MVYSLLCSKIDMMHNNSVKEQTEKYVNKIIDVLMSILVNRGNDMNNFISICQLY